MKKSSIEKNCKCCDKKISKVKKVILKKYNAQLYTGYNYSNEFVRIKIVPTKPIGKAKEITIDMTVEEVCDMSIKNFCKFICALMQNAIRNENLKRKE